MKDIKIGLSGSSEGIVTEALTARQMGSGSLAVYATPAMIALMEAAAVNALESVLDDGETSVGVRVDVQHLAATPLGAKVSARAGLTAVDRRRVTFSVEAWSGDEKIGEGLHERVIVNSERFMQNVESDG